MSVNLSTAIAAYSAGKFDEAINSLLFILEDNRLDWWAWYYLGVSYSRVGRTENAYRIMQVIICLCSDAAVKVEARNKITDLEDDLFGVGNKEGIGELRLSA